MVTFAGRLEWSYDETNRLGSGGFGTVYRAVGADGTKVAVKRVQLPSGDAEAAERLREREVKVGEKIAAMRPTARYLVAPIDIARVENDLYIVLPLAERSLDAAIRDGSFDPAERLQAFGDIARGLEDLRSLSLVHRDLKPENVLYLDGRWQLSDFGMTRDLDTSTETYTHQHGGTAPYIAPERWMQPDVTTPKSDLYALGVIGYEILLGYRPFDASSTLEWREVHRTGVPKRPDHESDAINRLLLRLLRKDPAERPQDAQAVLEALSAARLSVGDHLREFQRAATAAAERRGRADADWERRLVQHDARVAQFRQAVADMSELVSAALADVRGASGGEGTVRFSEAGAYVSWELTFEQAGLVVSLWPDVRDFLSGSDPLVTAGTVTLKAMDGTSWIGANAVCEAIDGRLAWKLWRFSAGESPIFPSAPTTGGPSDRRHGLTSEKFRQCRPLMQSGQPQQYNWNLTEVSLTAREIVALLSEALVSEGLPRSGD